MERSDKDATVARSVAHHRRAASKASPVSVGEEVSGDLGRHQQQRGIEHGCVDVLAHPGLLTLHSAARIAENAT
jgi:hypothetical protein